ncbi:MAG: efflux transporter periplasmic adaptor subunit [Deltaproteobacteria bacterium]|nr:MAG: efflux transporter periplasmic adaptor subunit [Deltaproteobacteria bacterium]
MLTTKYHHFSCLVIILLLAAICRADEVSTAKDESPEKHAVRILLAARNEAVISSRFFGTIAKIHVMEGKSFRQGQPLVEFDCRELAAESKVILKELEMHEATRKANAELYAKKMVGELENQLSRIKAGEARAKRKTFAVKMENCTIPAPFSGQVVELKAHEHESLQPGTPIMLIQDPASLEVQLHVPSRWLSWLKPGTVFRADIEETGSSCEVKVDRLGVRVDPVSRTVKIYGSFLSPQPDLLPGMSGYARFEH